MGVVFRLLLILFIFALMVFIFKRILTGQQQREVRSYVKIIAFSLLFIASLAILWRFLG